MKIINEVSRHRISTKNETDFDIYLDSTSSKIKLYESPSALFASEEPLRVTSDMKIHSRHASIGEET